MPPPAAFYCVTDARYFLGAVATVNSLRLLGHDEPIHVLDCGLDEHQRALLEPHVTLVPAPKDAPPWLLKTVAPLRHPADVMVLIDADIIVTRLARGADRTGRRAAGDRGRERHRPVRPRVGRAPGPRPGAPTALRLVGARLHREPARDRGPVADGRAPGPGRLRPQLLARQRPRLPLPLRRPGRPQRDPRQQPRRGPPARGAAEPAGSEPALRGSPDRGPRDAPLWPPRRDRAARAPQLLPQALARQDPQQPLLAADDPGAAGAGRADSARPLRAAASAARRNRGDARAPRRRHRDRGAGLRPPKGQPGAPREARAGRTRPGRAAAAGGARPAPVCRRPCSRRPLR